MITFSVVVVVNSHVEIDRALVAAALGVAAAGCGVHEALLPAG
jgi:hypothetical protein